MSLIRRTATLVLAAILASPAMAGIEAVVRWGDISWDETTGKGTMSVKWQSAFEQLAGFQFNIPCQIDSIAALECNENWSLNLISDVIICYCDTPSSYIQPGPNEVGLIVLEFTAEFGDEIVFDQPIFANDDADSIDLEYSDSFRVGYPPCPADVFPLEGGDGIVDIQEMLGVLADWGMSGSVYDVNYDDIVDVSDVLEVLQSWGECG
tara:strand:- start:3086 stop:3709 length:624 start_codon:yes stop_codon:yes gene_type:complete